MLLKDCLKKIKTPGNTYRSIPFWSWNSVLDEKELKWQVNEHKKAGLGGFFMHARGGLRTDYMEKEWMSMVKACVDESIETGIDPWLYDENGWPSGSGNGKVPEKNYDYRQKLLLFEEIEKNAAEEKRKIKETIEIYELDGKYIWAYYKVNPYYIDVLNHEAVKEFIDSTYEVYYKEFGEYFGNTIKGIFTDEPQYGRKALPWSTVLEKTFLMRYGYSVKEALPALYCNVLGYEKYRYDFFNLVTDLFTKSFSRQISKWCELHNCMLTGHVLLEETIGNQVMNSGSAMGFYQYMQLPGIDWLQRRIGNPVIVKQAASVAAQLDKKHIISELFGCSGENLSFADMKWIAEWQYVLGINLLCPHLEGYTLKGLRKRDCPPGLFYQQPWWEEYNVLQDYFAGLGLLLTEGKAVVPILIIHPVRSGWILFEYNHYDEAKRAEHVYTDGIDRELVKISKTLSLSQLDYHYGDEEILRQHARVEGRNLIVGSCSYEVVIVPPAVSLDISTVDLLEQLLDQGGIVIGFERFPYLCEGRKNKSIDALRYRIEIIPWDMNKFVNIINQHFEPLVNIETYGIKNDSIYVQVREYDDGYVLYAVNLDQKQEYMAGIYFRQGKSAKKIDLKGKGLLGCEYELKNDRIKILQSFAPMQSHVFMIGKENEDEYEADKQVQCVTGLQIKWLQDGWDLTDSDYNMYTLDYASFRRERDVKWTERKHVLKIQNELVESEYGGEVEIRYEFESKCDLFDEELYLVAEEPDWYKIYINGKQADTTGCNWYMDKSFKKIPIKGMIQKGKNKIHVKGNYFNSEKVFETLEKAKVSESEKTKIFYDSEVEAVYLVGDFEVKHSGGIIEGDRKAIWFKNNFMLDKRKKHIKDISNLTIQGYPFFRGHMRLSRDFYMDEIYKERRYILKFKGIDAPLVNVHVNGDYAGKLLWEPFEVDITDHLRHGCNKLLVDIVSSNRNMLGPHHHLQGELFGVTPGHFKDFENWTDEYCVVRFGIDEEADMKIIQNGMATSLLCRE